VQNTTRAPNNNTKAKKILKLKAWAK